MSLVQPAAFGVGARAVAPEAWEADSASPRAFTRTPAPRIPRLRSSTGRGASRAPRQPGLLASRSVSARLRCGQGLDQVIKLPLERLGVIQGGGDLLLDELAESLPQPMDGNLERPVGHVQRAGRLG